MTEASFAARMAALGLGRFPESDRAALERLAAAVEEAAARIRGLCGPEEEPSNVFRLRPAKGKGA